ncbi:hypothetical protein [Rhizobacter sp. LjRoot28]|jgi:hypothetical protein|uniref:hypothetical protein n=1 Tax=Rhizobacter sp. LjRoot28 TaxID=3342309 RepID=UPI003ECEDB73
MSFSPLFQRDLFAGDAGLSGWPSDGLDDMPPSLGAAAELRASSAQALRVVLGRARPDWQEELALAPAAPSRPPDLKPPVNPAR